VLESVQLITLLLLSLLDFNLNGSSGKSFRSNAGGCGQGGVCVILRCASASFVGFLWGRFMNRPVVYNIHTKINIKIAGSRPLRQAQGNARTPPDFLASAPKSMDRAG